MTSRLGTGKSLTFFYSACPTSSKSYWWTKLPCCTVCTVCTWCGEPWCSLSPVSCCGLLLRQLVAVSQAVQGQREVTGTVWGCRWAQERNIPEQVTSRNAFCLYIFWWARVCWPLLRIDMSPIYDFWGMSELPFQAGALPTWPPIPLETHLLPSQTN